MSQWYEIFLMTGSVAGTPVSVTLEAKSELLSSPHLQM